MRPDTTPEGLAKLPPYFKKDGVVTAGQRLGISDGAAALVLAERAYAHEHGPPAARAGWSPGAVAGWSRSSWASARRRRRARRSRGPA